MLGGQPNRPTSIPFSLTKPHLLRYDARMRNIAKKGFTLIELMIVVFIISIAAAVFIPKFASLIGKSNCNADHASEKCSSFTKGAIKYKRKSQLQWLVMNAPAQADMAEGALQLMSNAAAKADPKPAAPVVTHNASANAAPSARKFRVKFVSVRQETVKDAPRWYAVGQLESGDILSACFVKPALTGEWACFELRSEDGCSDRIVPCD